MRDGRESGGSTAGRDAGQPASMADPFLDQGRAVGAGSIPISPPPYGSCRPAAPLAALLLLAACTASEPTPDPRPRAPAEPPASVEYFTQRCLAYGYEPGTADMAECLQREELDYRIRPRAVR